MGFIADLIMTFFGIIFEQIDMHNGKGIESNPYGALVPSWWEHYKKTGRFDG